LQNIEKAGVIFLIDSSLPKSERRGLAAAPVLHFLSISILPIPEEFHA
jgi:hypothetical protein